MPEHQIKHHYVIVLITTLDGIFLKIESIGDGNNYCKIASETNFLMREKRITFPISFLRLCRGGGGARFCVKERSDTTL